MASRLATRPTEAGGHKAAPKGKSKPAKASAQTRAKASAPLPADGARVRRRTGAEERTARAAAALKDHDRAPGVTGSTRRPRSGDHLPVSASGGGKCDTAASLGEESSGERTADDLRWLAAEIKEAHSGVLWHAQGTAEAARWAVIHALKAGDALIRVKKQQPHGGWQKWLTEECGIGLSTARGYMRLAENRKEVEKLINPKRRPAAVLSIKHILKILASPQPKGGAAGRRATGNATATKQEHGTGRAGCHGKAGADDGAGPGGDRAGAADPERNGQVGRDVEPKPDRHTGRAAADHRRSDEADATAASRTNGAEGAGADHLDDATWLSTLAVRSKLADPTIFDQQALIWRQVQPAVVRLLELYEPARRTSRRAGWRHGAGRATALESRA